MVEFACANPECGRPIRFALKDLSMPPALRCPACGREHRFPDELREKFDLLQDLRAAIIRARPILGSAGVSVEIGGDRVTVPYNLLVGRMPAELALDFEGHGYRFIFSEDQPGD